MDLTSHVVVIAAGLVDCETGELRGARTAKLTPKERTLLAYLAQRPGVVVGKDELLIQVWGHPPGSKSRTLFSTVQRLRQKVEHDPDAPRHVMTIGRQGYMFRPLESDEPQEADLPAAVRRPLDSFVGREGLLGQLRAWSADPTARDVLGLVGLPGVGKTRLALEFAYTQQVERSTRVCFVDAGEASDEEALWVAVAQSLQLPPRVDSRLPMRIARVLTATGAGLLVVDGADGFVNLGSTLAALRRDGLDVLVVSREPVIDDCLLVGPLSGGDDGDGVKLFVERTRSRWARWRPSPEDRTAIATIVAMFSGSPLAIELAAHAVQVLSPVELAHRLSEGEELDGLERGIAWAWTSLSQEEQRCLTALAVFPADFQLDAAEAVCGRVGVLQALGRLADRALLEIREVVGGRRFRLPGTVRTFAWTHMDTDQVARDQAWMRFAAHFGAMGAADAIEHVLVHGTAQNHRGLHEELPNLMVAHRLPTVDGARATRAAVVVLLFHGLFERAAGLLSSVLERHVELPGPLEVWLRRMRAESFRCLGRVDEARLLLGETLELAKRRAPERVGSVLHTMGVMEENHGDPDVSESYLRAALEEHRSNGDVFRIGLSLGELATLNVRRGRMVESIQLFKDALGVLRGIPAPMSEVIYLGNQAVAEMKLGQLDAAEQTLVEAIATCRRLDAHRFEMGNLTNLGIVYWMAGNLERAEAAYRDVLSRMRDVGDEGELYSTLSALGAVHLRKGELVKARRLLDEAAAGLSNQMRTFQLGSNDLLRAMLCRLEHDWPRAAQRLEEATTSIEKGDLGELMPWLLAERGLVAVAQGHRGEAEGRLAEALAAIEATDSTAAPARWAVQLLETALDPRDEAATTS